MPFLSSLLLLQKYSCSNMKMNQQWSELQNKIESYVKKNPIGEQLAQKLHRKRLKTSCKFFQPFKQYFQAYPISYIQEPKPTYAEKQRFQEKVKLSTSRQMEYFRGSANNSNGRTYVEEEFMEELLMEDMRDRGLMENRQRRSLILGNLMVYGAGERIKSVPLGQGQGDLVSHQFAEPILQMDKYFQDLIIVRCRYWIYKFNYKKNSIEAQKRLKEEITSFEINRHRKSILIATYDQKSYRLYEWTDGNNDLACVKVCETFHGIHSMINLNSREFVIGQANQIFIQDLRCSGRETLKRIGQVGNDRFCSMVQIEDHRNLIGLSRFHFIDLFDIRRPTPSLQSVQHFCEQSPPSCLISFNWVTPMLIAYSPHQLGCSLLIDLNLSTPIDSAYNRGHRDGKGPILLYDSGKFYKGLHPMSICVEVQSNVLKIFHLDSSEGLALQILKKESQGAIVHLQTQNAQGFPEEPWKKWVAQKQIQPYLQSRSSGHESSEHSQSDQSEEMTEESHIFLKNNNYCSLDKFHTKLLELAKTQNQDSKGKEREQNDTYQNSFPQGEPTEKFIQIMKSKKGLNDDQGKISEQLLDLLEREWRV